MAEEVKEPDFNPNSVSPLEQRVKELERKTEELREEFEKKVKELESSQNVCFGWMCFVIVMVIVMFWLLPNLMN